MLQVLREHPIAMLTAECPPELLPVNPLQRHFMVEMSFIYSKENKIQVVGDKSEYKNMVEYNAVISSFPFKVTFLDNAGFIYLYIAVRAFL